MERWRPAVDGRGRKYPGYEVSDQGRVRSWLDKAGGGRAARPSIVRPSVSGRGLRVVTLRRPSGGSVACQAHMLVAIAFLGKRPRGRVSHHKNFKVTDNCASNLEWVTYRESAVRSVERKPRLHRAKVTEAQVRAIKRSKESTHVLAWKYGMAVRGIQLIRSGARWKHLDSGRARRPPGPITSRGG